MKTFYKDINLNSREEMVAYLTGHFRYNTANSWNRSTSYANDMKLYHLGLPQEQEDKLWALLDCENAYESINDILDNFSYEHDHQWRAGFNGKSGGYLVLYKGGWKYSEHKSYCTACGQRNFTSVEETGCKCGRCGKETRKDFEVRPKDVFTYPGKSVDQDEDFDFWSLEELQDRVRLVQEFDKLCDDIVAEAVYMSENCDMVEEEYFVPATTKKIVFG